MNILPKKSWHVRTRGNIEKVRRDEREAAAEEERRLERIAIAEREARTTFLRRQAQASTAGEREDERRFDVFEGVQEGKGVTRGNREREAEEKARKEDWEQRVGILTYLHKKGADDEHLWYLKPHEERIASPEAAVERLESKTESSDPLLAMQKHWRQMKGQEDETRRTRKADRKGRSQATEGASRLHQMREERRRREEKERRRTQALVGQGTPGHPPSARDERLLRFNTQFNPQLARR